MFMRLMSIEGHKRLVNLSHVVYASPNLENHNVTELALINGETVHVQAEYETVAKQLTGFEENEKDWSDGNSVREEPGAE